MSKVKTFGDLQVDANFRRLWDEVRDVSVFRQENGGSPVPIPQEWLNRPRSLATVLDEVFSYFATGAGKHRWCEKTPQHVQHLLALGNCFPPQSSFMSFETVATARSARLAGWNRKVRRHRLDRCTSIQKFR